MELIVNAEPEIPLKVPLNKSVLRYDLKAKNLKLKNLERFEKVAINLSEQADRDKHEALQKIKKK